MRLRLWGEDALRLTPGHNSFFIADWSLLNPHVFNINHITGNDTCYKQQHPLDSPTYMDNGKSPKKFRHFNWYHLVWLHRCFTKAIHKVLTFYILIIWRFSLQTHHKTFKGLVIAPKQMYCKHSRGVLILAKNTARQLQYWTWGFLGNFKTSKGLGESLRQIIFTRE